MNKAAIGIVEMKACPFCGAAGESHRDAPWQIVRCEDCGMEGSPHYTEAEAIAAWNTRTPDPIIMEMVEALEVVRGYVHRAIDVVPPLDAVLALDGIDDVCEAILIKIREAK